jgi:glycerate kinase
MPNKNNKLTVLIAPNAFKESLSAFQVSRAIAQGVKAASPRIRIIEKPIADGGDGTLEVLVKGTKGRFRNVTVKDPMGDPILARYGFLGDGHTAVIEMAEASGLRLVPVEKRNPLLASTYGTGELIKDAMNKGASSIILGIGGSATVDAGIGAIMALGGRFYDDKGKLLPLGGGALKKIHRIDMSGLDERLKKTKIYVACDVKNPLLGPMGTVAYYAPQKGATPKMMVVLDEGMLNLSRLVRKMKSINIGKIPGTGAAGGLSAGLMAFCNAELKSGIELVLDALKMDEALKGADLVITGEGKLDRQTAEGKAPAGLAQRAKKYGCPVIALTGMIGQGAELLHNQGITSFHSIQNGPLSLQESMSQTAILLKNTANQVMKLYLSAK